MNTAALTAPKPEMSPELELITRIADVRVRSEMESNRKALLAVVGFDATVTSAIATKLNTIAGVAVFVHPDLHDGSLPESLIASESATHFRNMNRGETVGGGAIVFAVPTKHLDVVGGTVREIKQLSWDALVQTPELWIDAGASLSALSGRNKEYLAHAIRGAYRAGLFTNGILTLARFILRLDHSFESKPLERALDDAICVLHIPCGAGRFKECNARGALKSSTKWAEELQGLNSKAEDALYLRNDRGTPLDRNSLRARLELLQSEGTVTPEDAAVFTALLDDTKIQAGHWRPTQEAVAMQLRWDIVEVILAPTKKKQQVSLGQATLGFFNENFQKYLSPEDEKLLEAIVSEESDAHEDDRELFLRIREELKADRRLYKRWEQFVYRKTESHPDLMSGLLIAAAELISEASDLPPDPRLIIRLDGSDTKKFWTEKNRDICEYLQFRYRGLPELLLGSGVVCDFGMWCRVPSSDLSESNSQSARQFKFTIAVISGEDFAAAADPKHPFILSDALFKPVQTTQFIWSLQPNTFVYAYAANMKVVSNGDRPFALLLQGQFTRPQQTGRASDGVISLEDRTTILDALDGPDGLLVNANVPRLDLGRTLDEGINKLEALAILKSDQAEAIRLSFVEFFRAYTLAVRAFVVDGDGIFNDVAIKQARLFGVFLERLRELARRDDCRANLWKPALSIGIAYSTDLPHVAISCPWHPFRLAEAAAKGQHLAVAFRTLLTIHSKQADLRTYAKSTAELLMRPWHPTIAIADLAQPKMLIESRNLADFGLMEPPTTNEGAQDAFDGFSKEAASELLTICQEYLELHPHERSNFSVVLFNADNRDLPARLADQLARKIETEGDLRCELILTHTDRNRLRQIYAEQNVAISRELDGALASEAAQSFLSRLRVGFLDVDRVQTQAGDGRVADIVFLHDVIARRSQTNWRKSEPPKGGWPSFLEHRPNIETRRQNPELGARKTEMLLVSAERPQEVQRYIDLIHDLHTDDKDTVRQSYVPVREVSFANPDVSYAINQAHKVANWVVTYDGIADLQLLRSNDVKVIRFVTRPGSSHNLIVSTQQTSKTLLARLVRAIDAINGGSAASQAELASKAIREAALISGRVVLRAARVENNALELLGLVLSKQALGDSLPPDVTPVAWLLLDDFAEWLGHRGKRADLLVLCVSVKNGQPIVELVVVESKFVGVAGHAQEAKSSMDQTKASTNDLKARVVLRSDVVNRRDWLARLADLLTEHGVFTEDEADLGPREWARLIRSDEAELRIRGLSLVFVHDCTTVKPPPIQPADSDQRQYVFDRLEIGRALRRLSGESAVPLVFELPPPSSSLIDKGGEAPAALEVAQVVDATPADTVDVPIASSAVEAASASLPPLTEAAAEAPPAREPVASPLTPTGHYPDSVMAYVNSKADTAESAVAKAWLDQTKLKLRNALRNYGLDAEVIGDRLTPNAALFRFKGSDEMTLIGVNKHVQQLLTSHAIDVMTVRAGLGEITLTIRRPNRATLPLSDLWKRRLLGPSAPVENGSFLLGEREQDGELVYLNLHGKFGTQHGPHTLIAGETGGGKGVLTRNILLDIMATNSPRHARIQFVDPKFGADYPWLAEMPHLDGMIVTDPMEAIATVQNLVQEMERRYLLITGQRTSDIDRYNAKVPENERLPRIYLFHDEIGDWMADKSNPKYREAMESDVVRLASKARAAGVHLFLITQRPDKDALPGQIKANMNNKIALRVSSAVNSNIVLDAPGAEVLLGQGHFIAKLANEPPPALAHGQSHYIDDDEAWALAVAIREQWKGVEPWRAD